MNLQTVVLQKLLKFNYTSLRTCTKLPEGIKYYGFTYYPRHENFKDPPCTPAKLFLVRRLKSMKGRTPGERNILEHLNLDGDVSYNGHITIVKNIPTTNALLWKVKHLIEIKPITWKGELPKDGDFSGTYLRDTGELKLLPMLKVSPEQMKQTLESNDEQKRLTRNYIKQYLKKKWLAAATYEV